MNFTEASRTVSYLLRMCKQGEIIRWTSQKHQEQSLTSWECADKEKWSDGLHRSIKNSHLHAEDVQTRRNGQTDFTEASKTVTYILRMCTQGKMLRWTSQKQTVTYMLRMCRQREIIRLTSQKHQEQSLTSWECADKVNWSDGLHRSIQKQSLTFWECVDKVNWSDGLHRSIKNSHLHAEDVQTRRNSQIDRRIKDSHLHAENVQTKRNGQMDFTEAWKTVTYLLRMCRQGELVRWTSQKHQK